MGEPIWCNVYVKVPTSWNKPGVPTRYDPDTTEPGKPEVVGRLCEALGADYDVEINGDVSIWHAAGEGNYGLADSDIEEVLDWCEKHLVPYRATDDPKYEFMGTIKVFDLKEVHERTGDADGNATMAEYEYNNLKAEFDSSDDLVAALDTYFNGLPGLDEIDISHLPALEPDSEEAEEAAVNAVLEGEVR